MKLLSKAALLFVISATAVNASTVINTSVLGTTNLYNAGYPGLDADPTAGLPFPEAFNLDGAIDPTAVSLMGSIFNFQGFDILNFTATGFVQDNGVVPGESITDADGLLMGTGQPTNFPDANFQGLPVYSLIGIFSTTSDFITPLAGTVEAAKDVANLGNPALSAFSIGTELTLDISEFSNMPLYLFLGENDGIFSDNGFIDEALNIGAYDVTIEAAVVPLPAAFWLFASCLIGIYGLARKQGS